MATAVTTTATPSLFNDSINQILQIAAASPVMSHHWWKNQDLAPKGYIKGMAVTFARVYCKLKAQDIAAVEMAKAQTGDANTDALAYYEPVFSAAGLANNTAGPAVLRHLFVLLTGLGMAESNGIYCTGRDRSATNTQEDTAEAGLFQASYNLRLSSPLLKPLFLQYKANPDGFLPIFQERVQPCSAADLENFGTGEGHDYQQLAKNCPAFAAEFTAIGLRNNRRHWGTIKHDLVEILPACDTLYQQVQDLVDQHNLCAGVALAAPPPKAA